MKNLIILFACFAALSAKSAEVSCLTSLRYSGSFYNKCPNSLVVTGTDVRITGNPPFPMVVTIVECARPITVCVQKKTGTKNDKTSKTSNSY